jgi:hypothetical protein
MKEYVDIPYCQGMKVLKDAPDLGGIDECDVVVRNITEDF